MGYILLLARDSETSDAIEAMIANTGMDLLPATDMAGAMRYINQGTPSIVIAEHGMDIDGLAILRKVRKNSPMVFILLSPDGDEGLATKALTEDADLVLTKPYDLKALSNSIPGLVERRMMIEGIRRDAERYNLLVSNLSDYIWTTDLNFNFTYISPSLIRVSGFTPDELKSMGFRDYVLPGSLPGLMRAIDEIKKAIITGEDIGTQSYTMEARRKDGGTEWLELRGNLVRDDDGNPREIIGVSRVITDRKLVQNRMENLQRMLDSFGSIYQLIIHQESERDLMQRTCDVLVDVTEFKIASVLMLKDNGNPPWTACGGDQREVVSQAMLDNEGVYCIQEALGSKNVVLIDVPSENCEGCPLHKRLDCQMTMAVQLSYKDDIYGVLNLFLSSECRWDEREHKLFEELVLELGLAIHMIRLERRRNEIEVALREETGRFRGLFENMTIPSCIFHSDDGERFTIIDINRSARELDEVERDEVVNLDIMEFAPSLKEFGLIEALGKVWSTGESEIIPMRYYRGERGAGWREYSIFMLRSGELVTTYEDLSVRKRYEDEIVLVGKKLELLEKVIRHDIINQISVIKGYEEIAEEIAENLVDDKTLTRSLQKIRDASDVILRQLDLTRDYEALGNKEASWMDISSLMQDAILEVELYGITLEVDVEGVRAFLDPIVVKAFANILDNSIKHGGGVTRIDIRFEENEDGGLLVIEDDGIGIGEERKESIFERGSGEHLGYGLYLTKEILAVTGMDIRENGVRNQGARFEIVIPPDKYEKHSI